MHSKVSSAWLPSYIKATLPVLEIFKMARYFPDRPHILKLLMVGDVPDIHSVLGVDSTCFQDLFCTIYVIIHKS